jgi:hypothetical protein
MIQEGRMLQSLHGREEEREFHHLGKNLEKIDGNVSNKE